MWIKFSAAVLTALAMAATASAGVVINEIFYHAPEDLDDLQFIELHNAGNNAVDITGWRLAKGIAYTFPVGTTIEAGGYVVVCKNRKEFRTHYRQDAAGEFAGSLKRSSDTIELLDKAGAKVDAVSFKSRAPWPIAPDGYSSSLERICPTVMATGPENWAPSPMALGTPKPAGTPGKKNATFSPTLPPAIGKITYAPKHAGPAEEISVDAEVVGDVATVELRYRVAGSGYEKAEQTVPMVKSLSGTYHAKIPPQKAKQIVRFRVHAVDKSGAERFAPHPNELRPAESVYVHERFKAGEWPLGFIINVGAAEFFAAKVGIGGGGGYGPPPPNPPARGKSAFVHVDPKTGEPTLFDFLSIGPRLAGYRIRFHKDRPLGDISTIVLIHEASERWVLAEPLAYEVYRRAGNAACRTDFVRTWIDDRPVGYQLQVEVVNKSFLRHNKLRTDGNLYKVNWFGNGIVASHEKKNNPGGGHQDVIEIVNALRKVKGDEQWQVIKKNFDVEQFINYFAVNMLLSHWDGFFNNHFVYHDVRGTGKWTIYPWDQDKTWGYHDGVGGYGVFYDMPLTMGMEGDAPKGWPKNVPPPFPFDYNFSIWWRPGSVFAKPLLANPQFRKHFLSRTKELLETVYTEKELFPVIDRLGDRLKEEVAFRAQLRQEDPKQAQEHLRRNLEALKNHLTKRRQFLLEQDEIRNAGRFDRELLKSSMESRPPYREVFSCDMF
jgi:hypothetical protein